MSSDKASKKQKQVVSEDAGQSRKNKAQKHADAQENGTTKPSKGEKRKLADAEEEVLAEKKHKKNKHAAVEAVAEEEAVPMKEVPKKKKKNKQQQEEVADEEEAVKPKKSKKNKEKQVEEEPVEEEQPTDKKKKKKDKSNGADATFEETKEKKKSKKDKTNGVNGHAHEEAEAVEEDVPKKKKEKKDKSNGTMQLNGDGGMGTSVNVRRNFYKEHPTVAAMSPADVAKLRKEYQISIGEPKPAGEDDEDEPELQTTAENKEDDFKPLPSFVASGLPEDLLACCAKFNKPTAIQSQCWPAILSGRDVIGIAETGSGKTMGFALPAMVHIRAQAPLGNGNARGPIVLVLAPTRELAMQTAEVTQAAGEPCGITTACIYGGAPKDVQIKAVRGKGVHIVVATPGRLLGLFTEGHLSLSRVTYLVLDEADRMLDLGFEDDMRAIIKGVGPNRQTLLFSATWPQEIQALGREFVTKPFLVTIGRARSEKLTANTRVKQTVEVIDEFKRDNRLVELLKEFHASRTNRVIIFVLYKKEVDRVAQMLQRKGFNANALSGDKNQVQRTQALADFKSGKVPLLIATDVAARGLDIPQVEYVINYSFPLTVADYVHRIGRTGRGGAHGVSYTFFTKANKDLTGELVGVLKEANQPVPQELLAFGTVQKRKPHPIYGNHYREDTGKPMGAPKKMTFD